MNKYLKYFLFFGWELGELKYDCLCVILFFKGDVF